MANRYAIATGNWSNPAIWDGGVATPTTGDTVRPNNFLVTIDQDITVADLRSDASAPAVANGAFLVTTIPGGGRIINANIQNSASTSSGMLRVTAPTGTLTINGNISAGIVSSGHAVVLSAAACVILVNGNVTGGTSGSTYGINATSGTFQLTITGTVSGASAGGGTAIVITSGTSTITINGNVIGGAGTGNGMTIDGSVIVTVNGNVTGAPGPAGAGTGIAIGTNASLIINGDVTSANANGVTTSSTGSLIVDGNVTAGTANAMSLGGSGAIDITGSVTASLTGNGIASNVTGVIRVRGPMIDASNGKTAMYTPFAVFPKQPAKTSIQIRGDAGFPIIGGSITLANFEDNGLPDPTDVRIGVTYGPDDTLVGTRYAALTMNDVWSYPVVDADVPASMGARLRDTATVASTGAQIAAALNDYEVLPPTTGAMEARSDWQPPYSYIGVAPVDTSDGALAWLITRIQVNSDGSVTEAFASPAIWNNRTSEVYT